MINMVPWCHGAHRILEEKQLWAVAIFEDGTSLPAIPVVHESTERRDC